jgi:NAD(P)-dependent dehydrogenase (short-subunit alcohol dehydrogenase family)
MTVDSSTHPPLFADRVAVVTGAGRGIGRATALLLAQHGAKVIVNDLGCALDGTGSDRSVADHVAHEIVLAGGVAIADYSDVSRASQAEALMRLASAEYGGLDALLCFAGTQQDKTVLKMDEASFDSVYQNTVKSALFCTQSAGRVFASQRRGGHVVLCTSRAGLFGNYGQCNSGAAAAAVYGLMRTFAIELKKQEVRVNALAPIARTRMTEGLSMFSSMPEQTYGAHFVAPAALFLASRLCGEMSGEVLSVAGTKVSLYQVVESDGAMLEDPKTPWTAVALQQRYDQWSRMCYG